MFGPNWTSSPVRADPTNAKADCSKFIIRASRSIGLVSGIALDIPSGEGRHSMFLASRGMRVVAADIDAKTIERGASTANRIRDTQISFVRVDATKPLPFKEEAFDLVLICHFHIQLVLGPVERLIKPGGYLIAETYGAQGENWRTLPHAGEIATRLSQGFRLLHYREAQVPKQQARVTVRTIAQKMAVIG